jgi:hypothetical protein
MRNNTVKEPDKLVAIVVAHSNRAYITPSEEISLRHLNHYLGKYDKYLLIPKSLEFELPGLIIKPFDDGFFGSVDAHKQMLFSSEYYQAFADYKYILTYHLDALVFSDQLEQWCDRDYDFIGAPWVKHPDSPNAGMVYEGKVGNSGFSLKKVSTFLKILHSPIFAFDPSEYWASRHAHKPLPQRLLNFPKRLLMYSRRFNNLRFELDRWTQPEELFLIDRASHYYPDFRVPEVEEALRFAFEIVPRYCFKLNNHELPFGCHAWERYDKSFWEPYLLK